MPPFRAFDDNVAKNCSLAGQAVGMQDTRLTELLFFGPADWSQMISPIQDENSAGSAGAYASTGV